MTVIASATLTVRISAGTGRSTASGASAAPNDHGAAGQRPATQPRIGALPSPIAGPGRCRAPVPRSRRRTAARRAGRESGGGPAPGFRPAAGRVSSSRRHADRDVDEEHQAPVSGGDEQPAQRRDPSWRWRRSPRTAATARSGARAGTPAAPAPGRTALSRRRPCLHHLEGNQRGRRRRDRAQQRADRERLEADDEHTPAPSQSAIAAPAMKRCERDVVRVHDPRQRRDRRAGERARDVRECDVHYCRVHKSDYAAQRRDREHSPRPRPAPHCHFPSRRQGRLWSPGSSFSRCGISFTVGLRAGTRIGWLRPADAVPRVVQAKQPRPVIAWPPPTPTSCRRRGHRANHARTVLASRPQALSEARAIAKDTRPGGTAAKALCPGYAS